MSAYASLPASGHHASWTTWDSEHTAHVDLTWENEGWTANCQLSLERAQVVIRLSASWMVQQFIVFRDLDEPDLWLATDGHGRWGEMNGAHRTELDGCVDVDIPGIPFTNVIPIRRLPRDTRRDGRPADVHQGVRNDVALSQPRDGIRR